MLAGLIGLDATLPVCEQHTWIFKARTLLFDTLRLKGILAPGVVHVVALNALIHNPESAAHHGLIPLPREIVGKPETRSERCPEVVLRGPSEFHSFREFPMPFR